MVAYIYSTKLLLCLRMETTSSKFLQADAGAVGDCREPCLAGSLQGQLVPPHIFSVIFLSPIYFCVPSRLIFFQNVPFHENMSNRHATDQPTDTDQPTCGHQFHRDDTLSTTRFCFEGKFVPDVCDQMFEPELEGEGAVQQDLQYPQVEDEREKKYNSNGFALS